MKFDELDDEQFDTEFVACTTCGGSGSTLGFLGELEWHRCTRCGIVFTLSPEKGG
jgi:hypothetical protein|tara:strand:+ start:4392 stop:4556 length:165 start_codon:yes stop_codon:yes gene_type:complete